MPGTAAIEVSDLSKTFVTADAKIPALELLNFRVEAGEFVAVLGPSGCGKTTLMRIWGPDTATSRG